MYGEHYPVYVYGIKDKKNSSTLIFYNEDIEELDIRIYGSCIIRHCLCDAIYGLPVNLHKRDTNIEKRIKKAMKFLQKKYKDTEELYCDYFLVVSGYDWKVPHKKYEMKDEIKNKKAKENDLLKKENEREFDSTILNYFLTNKFKDL